MTRVIILRKNHLSCGNTVAAWSDANNSSSILPRNSPHHGCAAQMRTSSTPAWVWVLRVPCTHKLRNNDAANDGVKAVYNVVGMSGMVEPAFVILNSVSSRNSARTRSLSVEAFCSSILVTLLSMSIGPSIDSNSATCDDAGWMPSTFWRRMIARRARFNWTWTQQWLITNATLRLKIS